MKNKKLLLGMAVLGTLLNSGCVTCEHCGYHAPRRKIVRLIEVPPPQNVYWKPVKRPPPPPKRYIPLPPDYHPPKWKRYGHRHKSR